MTTTTNLAVTHIAAAQSQKEVTANAAFSRLDAAITDTLSVSVASGNGTVTLDQAQQAARILATGATTAGRTVTLPVIERPLIVAVDVASTQSVTFVRGTATLAVAPGGDVQVYLDGTTNGLEPIGSAGGLLAANNLSDVTNAATARTNLGATTTGAAVFTAASEGAARTALGATTTGGNLFTAADAAAARTVLGSGTTGDAVFQATTAAAARTSLGATTTGANVFTAADAEAARTAIGLNLAHQTLWFGDGSDGDVTISGAVTLTRDMFYRNLTIAAGAALNPLGFRIFVSDTLDLTAAPAGGIQRPGA